MESVVLKRSNLQMVKEVALCFLYQEMQEMDIPYMVIHPVFESSLLQMKIDGEIKLVNLCEENSQKQRVISEYEKRINAAETVLEVYCIIRKSYKLAFCKHIWRYLDEKDRGTLLADAWTRSEFPSRDVNVSINEKYVGCSEWHKKKSLWMELNFPHMNRCLSRLKSIEGSSSEGIGKVCHGQWIEILRNGSLNGFKKMGM